MSPFRNNYIEESYSSIERYPLEDALHEDGLYRYLLQSREEHDDKQHRAMDRIWSKATCRLREVVLDSGNQIMYYLSDGPERASVSEELMLIPKDTVASRLRPKRVNFFRQ